MAGAIVASSRARGWVAPRPQLLILGSFLLFLVCAPLQQMCAVAAEISMGSGRRADVLPDQVVEVDGSHAAHRALRAAKVTANTVLNGSVPDVYGMRAGFEV